MTRTRWQPWDDIRERQIIKITNNCYLRIDSGMFYTNHTMRLIYKAAAQQQGKYVRLKVEKRSECCL